MFASKNWNPKLQKRGRKQFSISIIDRSKKQNMEPSLPALLDFPGLSNKSKLKTYKELGKIFGKCDPKMVL